MRSREPHVTVHRIDPSCGDEDTCEQFTTVDTDPAGGYIVAKIVTDPAVLRAHRRKIGPGEILVRMDRKIAPEAWS